MSDALARAEQEVWERAGLIEGMRAELLLLGETTAQTRRDADERVAIMASMEAQIAGLREAIERAEQAAEVARLEREIAGLRATALST